MKLHLGRRTRRNIHTAVLFVFAFIAALLFIMPTVLTISNSFMTETEINANYGAMIESELYFRGSESEIHSGQGQL